MDALDIECIDLSTIRSSHETGCSPETLAYSDNTNFPRPYEVNSKAFNSLSVKLTSLPPQESLDRVDAATGGNECDIQYESDMFEDDEFPDLETIIRPKESTGEGKPQTILKKDETLYPGPVQVLKESMDYG
ncbi:hypothetical protein PC116_g32505 [Phytophthora cactorum]|nr:hypothetical protein PC116_g32505 [Phytophthora cactorum]